MPRTPNQAVQRSKEILVGYGGMCLKFVRTCYGIPARDFSAKVAWEKAKYKHKTSSLRNVPVGAFLFMSHPKSKYGHVALYLGNGLMRTTNSSTNRIHTDKVSKWTAWGYTVQGWTEDLNGVRIKQLKPAPVQKRPDVRELQAAVNAKKDNSWGPDTDKRLFAVREASVWRGQKFPERVQYTQRVVGTRADGMWGPRSQRAHYWAVLKIQRALNKLGFNAGTADGHWGPKTEAAFQAARKAAKRR